MGYSGARAHLLAPDGRTLVVEASALATHLRGPVEAAARATFDDTVGRAGLSGPRARVVADALLVADLGGERVADGLGFGPRCRRCERRCGRPGSGIASASP